MKDATLTFARAVLWGSVAGGGPFMVFTIPVLLSGFDWSQLGMAIWVAVMPVVFAGAFVLPAAVFSVCRSQQSWFIETMNAWRLMSSRVLASVPCCRSPFSWG